jgi:hypothetical protein
MWVYWKANSSKPKFTTMEPQQYLSCNWATCQLLWPFGERCWKLFCALLVPPELGPVTL